MSASRPPLRRALSCASRALRAAPASTSARGLSSSVRRCADQEDPGGKPNDGRYPTVYDDFYNITSAPSADSDGGLIQGGGATHIASMDEQSFTLNDGLVLACPIILLSGSGAGSGGLDGTPAMGGVTVLMWDAPALDGVVLPNGRGWEGWVAEQEAVWKALEVVQPRPEILIFGTGKTVLPLPANIKKYLNSLGMQVDVQNTRAACSTYNLLVEEGRRVGVALLPNVRVPMPFGN
ncbi:hypothetical protein V8E36_002071 [Tilletia maclaganii]